MKRIHIARNRQPLGHFTPEEVTTGLRSGRFMLTDLAWREPMDSWIPLSEFTDLPVSETLEVAPPLPVSPEGFGEREAESPLPTPAGREPAWERREKVGWLEGVVGTVKSYLSTPMVAFRQMSQEGGLVSPLIFYVVVGTITSWVSIFYQAVLTMVNPELALGDSAKVVTVAQVQIFYAVAFVLMPALLTFGAFVSAGLYHFSLLMMGGVKKPFEASFRVICYAWGVASIFQLIPICGSYVHPIWGLVLIAIGLKEVHRSDYMRSVCAVILPGLLCCGLLIGLTAVAAAVGGAVK